MASQAKTAQKETVGRGLEEAASRGEEAADMSAFYARERGCASAGNFSEE